MKHLILALTLTLLPSLASYPPEYAEILQKYVNSSGVDYAGLHENSQDKQKLQTAVDYLKKIMDKYPTKGPLSGGDVLFFHKKSIVIAGKKTSFDKLEQKVIRPVYQESRIHFALNCASKSCPPLRNEPFSAKKLNAQLNEQAEQFINGNSQGVVVSNAGIKLSKIFEWYAEDFGGKGNLVTWINHYRTPKVSSDQTPQFLKYNWGLNTQ